MTEKKPITAESFMKGLEGFENKCASCRFFEAIDGVCEQHKELRKGEDPRCKDWRYFA